MALTQKPSMPVKGDDFAPPSPNGAGPEVRRDTWIFLTTAIALGCLIVTLVAVGLAFRFAGDDDQAGDGQATEAATVAPATFDIEMGDLYVRPGSVQVRPGQQLTLKVTNRGALPHDLKVGGTTGTALLNAGGTETVTVGPFKETTEAWCTVPGHKEAGMVLAIQVRGSAASAAAAGGTATAAGAKIDANATPAPDWKRYDPELRPAPGGTAHAVTFRATETVLEVAPGVTQEMWTFNGQAPGPVLRGKVGDIFTVTLINEGKLGHSIDFHASKVAWDDEMRTIQPGESLVYQFEAKFSGIFMYHCGTAPALHHIGNGMFGAIVIDPPGLPAVDHEYLLVQSELYLGGQGQPGDLTKMTNEQWDAVVFNSYFSQYKFQPIRVEPGQRVRVWVLDAGPSENSSFHIVGTVFDTVYKEGAYLSRPDASRGGAQVLDLQPAQGGFVEFTFDEPGLYPIVTHKFANVGKGALGLFQAGESAPAGAAGH